MDTIESKIVIGKSCCGVSNIGIEPVLADPQLFRQGCEDVYAMYERESFDVVVTTKLSGTVFATYLAQRMGKGLVIVTCPGQNKDGFVIEEIDGTRGKFSVGMREGLIQKGQRIVIVVDSLSKLTDVRASINMVEKQGASVIKITGFVDDTTKEIRESLFNGYPIVSRIRKEDL